LKGYDENQDGRIDVSELKTDKFAWDLKKEWGREKEKRNSKLGKGKRRILKEIVRLTQDLQKEMINSGL
jgi:hypothetical protein